MPFTYRQVKDLYDILHSSGAVSKSLPDWSSEMNTNTGGDLYNAGLNDNFIKRSSVAIDRGLEAIPGLTESSRQLGAGFGSLFGQEEAGAQIGEGLPRMVANFAPTILGGLATGPAAPFVIGAGLAGTAALSGSQTYTDTGSPAAGVLSGITNAALPGITGKIEQGILGKLGARAVAGPLDESWVNQLLMNKGVQSAAVGFPTQVSAVNRLFGNTGQNILANLGGQVGAAGIMEASGLGQDWLSSRPFHDVFSPETALNLTLGQLPFAALHLGAKALKLSKSPMEQADALQQRIDLTQKGLDLKAAADAVANKTLFEQLPNLTPEQRIAKSTETQAEIDARLEVLGIRRQEIEAAPTENNIEELQKIAQEEAAVVQEAIDKTGGVGLGLSKASGKKLDVIGTDHFYKDSTGYHVITIADDPKNAGLVYPDGKPVLPGDRVGFPGGNYDPAVNKDVSPNFQLPKDKFTKVIDRPSTRPQPITKEDANWYARGEGKKLPPGQIDNPIVELPAQATAYDLEQLQQHVKELRQIREIVSAPGMTWGGAVSALESVNQVRKQLGRPEIDLANLRYAAEKQGIVSADGAIKALIDETSRLTVANSEAKAERLKEMQEEVDTEALIRGEAQMGDPQYTKVVDYFNSLGAESGNRNQVATSGLFWRKAKELLAQGKLSKERMENWIEAQVVPSGKGLKKEILGKELVPLAQKVLASREKEIVQIVGETAARAVAGETVPEYAKVFKKLVSEGNMSFTADDVKEVAKELGFAHEEAEPGEVSAEAFAEGFMKSQTMEKYVRAISGIENEKLQIARSPNEERKQLPAGGGFVWGLAPYDPTTNRLGDKHTLPKSGVISEQQLKAIGGRGKPLQDVEIQMMKAVDEAVGGKAFEGGSVNVKKLAEVLKDNPVQVEVKKFGADNTGDVRFAQIEHELDTKAPDWKILSDERFKIKYPDLAGLIDEYTNLEKGNGGKNEAQYKWLGPKSEQDMPGYVEITLEGQNDHLAHGTGAHFPGRKTLGWIRGYEGERDGQKVFNLIEHQPQALQDLNKGTKQAIKLGKENPRKQTADILHLKGMDLALTEASNELLFKAAIDHAKSIGATKIFLPDWQTASMTEGHDKAANDVFNPNEANVELAKKLLANPTGVSVNLGYQLEKLAKGEQVGSLAKDKLQSLGFDITKEVSQAGGMALHYDTTSTSAMRKLTGDMGSPVELGTHDKQEITGGKEVFREDPPANTDDVEVWFNKRVPELEKQYPKPKYEILAEDYIQVFDVSDRGKGKGSPVFKNPDGSPKSQISGTVYDLTKIQGISEAQGGLTLGDPARSPSFDPFVPQTDKAAAIQKALTTDGVGLMKLVSLENSPQGALARDLLTQFPSALALVKGEVREMNGAAAHMNLADQGSSIYFGPSVVSREESGRNQTILHEVVHGLTMQLLKALPEGHPMRISLEGIRQRAIEALPKEWRDSYNKAISEDFISQYSKTGDSELYAGLGSTPEARSIIYALLNHDEMVAQGFSEPKFQKYLQGVSGGPNLWNKFVNWTRELLGLGNRLHDNAFAELMGTTGELMQYGEYLASVQDFGERYFESKGKGGEYGKAQTQRALGLIADNANGTSPEELVNWLTKENDYRFNPGLSQTSAKLEASFSANDEIAQSTSSILNEVGHDPSQRGLDDLVDTAIGEGKAIQDELDLLQPSAASYVFEKLKDHRDVLAMVQAATKAKNEGVLNIAEPKLLRGPLDKAIKNIDRILKNQDRQIEFAGQLTGLQAMEPGPLMTNIARSPGDFNNFVEGVKDNADGVGSWLTKFLEPMGQLARRLPVASEILSKGFQLVANARKDFSDRVKVFGVDISSPHINPEPTHESVKQSEKVFSTPKLLNAANSWVYWNQKIGGDSVQMLLENHPEIAKVLNGLSKEERAFVHDIVTKQGMSTQVGHSKNLESITQIAAHNGAGVILAETPGKASDAVALSDQLLRAIQKAKDPLTQWAGQAEIQAVQAKMLPDAFLSLLKFSQESAEKIAMVKETYDKNPFWATGQRMEQFLIKGFRGKEPLNLQASSMTEARDLIEKKGLGKNTEIVDQWKGKEDEPFAYPNMTPEMLDRMKQIEENQIGMLKKVGVLVTDEDVAAFRRSSAVQQIAKETSMERSLPDVQLNARTLSKGAEELPWMWNHISHAQKESTYWSRQLLRAQARTYLMDGELASNPELRAKLKTHFENLLEPDPAIAQKLTKFASVWFMGFNLASSLVNAAQPFVTHVAELTAMTGKPIDSYRRILGALKEAGGSFANRDWATPEHAKFMEDAARDGERGLSMFDDEAAAQESVATNYKRAMMKNKPQSLGQKLGTAAGSYSTAAMWVFRHGEQLNATAALLAGFDLAKEQGLLYDAAKAKAYEFNHAVNYSGGRMQRPVGLFSGRGPTLRTAAMLGSSLQSYVLGTTFQIGRYLQRGLFRPAGIKPYEVFAARKAALQMLGTQFAAAGLLGLPFASGAIAVLNQLFPDLELNKKLREGVNGFLSSDSENGSMLTDIAMTGVPSMLGWDLQSRLSMGNTLPGVSEVNGFQPENLMGPFANVVRNFVGGVQGWSKGEANAGLKFLPNGAKSLIQTGANLLSGEDAIRDYQGRPLADPSVGERLGLSLGFQPKRLSDQNAASRISTQATEVVNRQKNQENQDFAQEVLKGNFGNVRQQLIVRSQADKSYNPQDAVRAISRSAEEQTFPRDLRREGTLGTNNSRASFLNSFSNLSSPPSEEARFLFRQQIEQKLGLSPGRGGSELELVRLVDRLRLAQPTASRSELQAAAQLALRRHAAAQPMLTSQTE